MLSRLSRRTVVGALVALCALFAVPVASAGAWGGHGDRDRGRGGGDDYGRVTAATTLALDPTTAGVLTDLGVAVAPTGAATASDAGISFPIVSSPREIFGQGIIRHAGGISLTAGDTTAVLKRFVIDLQRGVLTAKLEGDGRDDLLKLDLTTAKPTFGGDSFSFGPVGGSLTSQAAELLNTTFGVDAFAEGLKIGDATIALSFG